MVMVQWGEVAGRSEVIAAADIYLGKSARRANGVTDRE
jgi:hypothetical protein